MNRLIEDELKLVLLEQTLAEGHFFARGPFIGRREEGIDAYSELFWGYLTVC